MKAHVEASEAFDDSPLLALVVALEPQLANQNFLQDLGAVEKNVLEEGAVEQADVTLITAHQAKGLEWDRVHVAHDFAPEYAAREKLCKSRFWKEEMGLLYVAVTRARRELVIETPVTEWIAGERGVGRKVLRVGDSRGVVCEGCGRAWEVRVVMRNEGLPGLKSFSTVRMDEYGGDVGGEGEEGEECFWCVGVGGRWKEVGGDRW